MQPILTRALVDDATRAADPGAPIRFTISTTGEKRDGLDLDMTRFRLENFSRNPVLLWMHGREARGSLPLGRWQNLRRDGESISGEAVFDQEDAFAVEVERKYRNSFLNAVSVSWIPQRVSGDWQYDMLEASAVGVPADPDAVMIGRDFAVAFEEFERKADSPLGELTVKLTLDDSEAERAVMRAYSSEYAASCLRQLAIPAVILRDTMRDNFTR